MSFPTAITFLRTPALETLRAEIIEQTRALERRLDDILACRVVVEAESRLLQPTPHYGVHVRVAMPCHELEAGGKPVRDRHHADPHLTVAQTFDDLFERLDAFVRLRCSTCTHYRGCAPR